MIALVKALLSNCTVDRGIGADGDGE